MMQKDASSPPPAPGAGANVEPVEEDQIRYLEQCKVNVRQQAANMVRAIDAGDLEEVLKFANLVLGELRTSLLSPQKYYELFLAISTQLSTLESFFNDAHSKGKKMNELYELVQHAGNIIPRLYLLVIAGSIYIKTKEAPAKYILKDLVEMCKGVQHPMRGLFLRHYLLQLTRDKLPDDSDQDKSGGTVRDSVDFVLHNFIEMNKLWVRMQHQGAGRDRERREKERGDLRVLVGTNLVRLSSLEGVDEALYSDVVLPAVLEQVVGCQDCIAQQYLMEVIAQVFPDEFHLRTLDTYLKTLAHLEAKVDVIALMVTLVKRLAKFGLSQRAKITDEMRLFETFLENIQPIVEHRSDSISTVQVLQLHEALLDLVLSVYPERLAYIDQVYARTSATLEAMNVTSIEDAASVKILKRMIMLPLEAPAPAATATGAAAPPRNTLADVLCLEKNVDLLRLLTPIHKKQVALSITRSAIERGAPIPDPEKIDRLVELIRPLIKDEPGLEAEADEDKEEFEENQNLVAKLVHILANESSDMTYRLFYNIRRHFGQGGFKRVRHTLVPLFFASMRLCHRVYRTEQQEAAGEAAPAAEPRQFGSIKILRFLLEIVNIIIKAFPETGLRLALQAALCADNCNSSEMAYDFMTAALLAYETEISESRAQLQAMQIIISTLQSTKNFTEDNYDTLAKKCTMLSSKLLKKPDQCRAVVMCSHLFWTERPIPATPGETAPEWHDGSRVLECLNRSVEIADKCMAPNVHAPLFIEILNEHLFYYAKNVPEITADRITELVNLVINRVSALQEEDLPAIMAYKQNTLRHIRWHQASPREPAEADKYAAIAIPH
ncbi:Vacuolar protein sorting 35 (Vps35) [Paratrimastix pyriformis]|uniref:Vacuolar protein sorting-associated protein 35 n=1 Tax=Paratrimastix pyriformis TaxID=342808 RepID=A0ABQ8U1U7_9EUKA|nr:Vacuolar protein sorting 35 (Vps35) [Paratrimastix pyriformis]